MVREPRNGIYARWMWWGMDSWFSENIAGYKCISPEDGLIDNLQSIIKNVPKEYSEFINEPVVTRVKKTGIHFLVLKP